MSGFSRLGLYLQKPEKGDSAADDDPAAIVPHTPKSMAGKMSAPQDLLKKYIKIINSKCSVNFP
ncbi:hypothetical protein [Microcoleus sp. F4-D5]|uniref:hypothetical protein n=1 Tax=Microcoleus sp. F4-D5 TaxID=2818760 RepID=UPI002FD65AF3